MNQSQFHHFRNPLPSSYFQVFQPLQRLVLLCIHAVFSLFPSASNPLIYSSSESTVVCFQGTLGTGTLGQTGPTAGATRTRSSRHTDTHICEPLWKNTNTTWKLMLLCILFFRHRPAKKTTFIFTFCVHELLYSYTTDESRSHCMQEGFTTECS